jgi:enoyl-CoA hydratase
MTHPQSVTGVNHEGSDARSGCIYHEVHQNAAWITISNPSKRNALSINMMDQLGELLDHLKHDPTVRVVVLRGEGDKAFAAGADITEFETARGDDDVQRAHDRAVTRLFAGLSDLGVPLIAMIGGHCIGAGLAVALAADIRIANDSSSFAIPAARLGIGYPTPLTRVLATTVGPGAAADILFTGRRLSASEALSIDLINRVVSSSELEPTVRSLATSIGENAPLSIRAAKASIRATTRPELVAQAEQMVAACGTSDDMREGSRAFVEKRVPRFRGI